MKSFSKRCLLSLVCLLSPNLSYSQNIQVSLPDTSGQAGASITIPIQVGELTDRNVLLYQAIIVFDKNVLKATGASSAGTLSEPFGAPALDISVEGEILVAGTGEVPLDGSGSLVDLSFDIIGNPGDRTDLKFAGFTFNTGLPPATTNNGKFTVIVPRQPDIDIDPTSKDFGNVFVNSSAAQTFVVKNLGSATLDVTATNLNGADADQFSVDSGAAPFTLAPGDSKDLNISFAPTSLGAKSATLEILSNDPNQNTLIVPLTGNGVSTAEPDINVKPVQFDFGEVRLGTASIEAFTVSNSGAGNLVVNSINLSGPNADQFIIRGRAIPFNIASADSEIFQVSFQPESEGSKNATIEILTNDPDEDTLKVALTGTGVSAIELMPSIAMPENGAAVCGDSALVKIVWVVTGGVQPFTVNCEVNGIVGTRVDEMILMKVPVAIGENSLVATCSVVDAIGATDTSSTSITVFRNPPPSITFEIISPLADTIVCDDEIEIIALARISDGTPPLIRTCQINGVSFSPTDSIFSATVPLVAGDNEIIASCTVLDSCGFEMTGNDTISVFSDPTPPECNLNFENYPTITGRVSDPESGIARFEIIETLNRTITIDSFEVGAKVVNFVLDKIDPNASANFLLKVFNRAGCEVICDPVDVTLSPSNTPCRFNFVIPEKERFLYVQNHGVYRIVLQINQKEFNLVAVADGAINEDNSYSIPLNGESLFDISSTLLAGDNEMTLTCDGPEGSFANVLITDARPAGDIIVLDSERGVPILPEEFTLAQNYPNPFNPATHIAFDLPEKFPRGLHVQIRIYNLLGEQVRTLVDEDRMPGHYVERWDGTDRRGRQLPSGIYLYQLSAGSYKKTRRMVMLR